MSANVLDIALTVLLVAAAVWTVSTARMLRSVIGLAATSALLTAILFRLDSPLAAVFELSVCAGLIPAILVSAVGLTARMDDDALSRRKRAKLKVFALLPVILAAAAWALVRLNVPLDFALPAAQGPGATVQTTLWNLRQADLVGQIAVLLAAAFGVVVLLKGKSQ
jgi:NADH-quinone oxidoreductase subunit J